MLKYDEREQTPATPAIPQIHALDAQLDDILAEGPDARYERHALLARIVQAWARRHFAVFAEEGFESPDADLCRQHARDLGRGSESQSSPSSTPRSRTATATLKDKTFRIAHMGDTQEWEIRGLLATIDQILGH